MEYMLGNKQCVWTMCALTLHILQSCFFLQSLELKLVPVPSLCTTSFVSEFRGKMVRITDKILKD